MRAQRGRQAEVTTSLASSVIPARFRGEMPHRLPGLRVFIIVAVLGSKKMVPDTEYGAVVSVLVFGAGANDECDGTGA